MFTLQSQIPFLLLPDCYRIRIGHVPLTNSGTHDNGKMEWWNGKYDELISVCHWELIVKWTHSKPNFSRWMLVPSHTTSVCITTQEVYTYISCVGLEYSDVCTHNTKIITSEQLLFEQPENQSVGEEAQFWYIISLKAAGLLSIMYPKKDLGISGI